MKQWAGKHSQRVRHENLERLQKKLPKRLFGRWSTSHQSYIPLTKCPISIIRGYGLQIQRNPLVSFVSAEHIPQCDRWDTFCVRKASSKGRRSSPNQSFLMIFCLNRSRFSWRTRWESIQVRWKPFEGRKPSQMKILGVCKKIRNI